MLFFFFLFFFFFFFGELKATFNFLNICIVIYRIMFYYIIIFIVSCLRPLFTGIHFHAIYTLGGFCYLHL